MYFLDSTNRKPCDVLFDIMNYAFLSESIL